MHTMYQVMQRNGRTGGMATWANDLFETPEEAATFIAKEGRGGAHYVVVPTDGYPEYTVEETVSRTMHKLPVLVGKSCSGR